MFGGEERTIMYVNDVPLLQQIAYIPRAVIFPERSFKEDKQVYLVFCLFSKDIFTDVKLFLFTHFLYNKHQSEY